MTAGVAHGLRLNNPGNLRASGPPWRGQTGVDDRGFVIFDTPESGLRAIGVCLLTYQRKYGMYTVTQLIDRWAPPNENDTDAYVQAVAGIVGVRDSDLVRLSDPSVLSSFIQAIVQHENGSQPYTERQLMDAANIALGMGPVLA